MKFKIFITPILVLCVHFSFSQIKKIQKIDGSYTTNQAIDSTLNTLMAKAKVTGIAISVLNNNQIVYSNAFGFKNNKTKEQLDTGTIFCAASLSKAVFAYICMQLVQDGLLNLDKPLSQYLDKPLPQYEYYADLASDERWKQFTARMCLSHTTGLPNWWFLNPYTSAFDSTGKLAIYFTPGSKYAYSGEGIKLLQMVVEKITGKNLEDLAQEKLFQPLGLQRASYIWQQRFENNFAYGHTEKEEVLGKKKRKKAGAAGSMEISMADYARIIANIMQQKGLQKQFQQMMVTPQINIHSKTQFPTLSELTTKENEKIHLSYGLGWGLLQTPYGKAFFKEGHDDDGWLHYNINFIDKGIALIIMSNSLNGEKIFKEVLEKTIGDTFTPWQWENYIPYQE